jgi:nitrate reductase assembly molybdenum cofactor insertion protein NarJ
MTQQTKHEREVLARRATLEEQIRSIGQRVGVLRGEVAKATNLYKATSLALTQAKEAEMKGEKVEDFAAIGKRAEAAAREYVRLVAPTAFVAVPGVPGERDGSSRPVHTNRPPSDLEIALRTLVTVQEELSDHLCEHFDILSQEARQKSKAAERALTLVNHAVLAAQEAWMAAAREWAPLVRAHNFHEHGGWVKNLDPFPARAISIPVALPPDVRALDRRQAEPEEVPTIFDTDTAKETV